MSERIMNMPTQDEFNAKKLENWALSGIRSIFDNSQFVPTGEPEKTYKGDPAKNDLCTWREPAHGDYLTKLFLKASNWIEKHIIVRWKATVHHVKTTDATFAATMEFDSIMMVMDVLSCTLASVLLATTVAVLAVVRPLAIRIVIIGITGTLFALLLKLMAGKISRGEVFGAIAAFYAVAVVFVGTTGDGGSN